MNARHRDGCEEVKESQTVPGQEKVQDLSLDSLKQSKAVIISCWSLLNEQWEEGKQTLVVTSCLWTNCEVSLQESYLVMNPPRPLLCG